MLALALGALAVFVVFAYFQMPLVWWTIAAALLAWFASVIGDFSFILNISLATALVVVAAVLNLPFIRRKLLTDHILAVYRRILPDMSQTEKEAIDAGTVWWDGDLFSGRPDWGSCSRCRGRS